MLMLAPGAAVHSKVVPAQAAAAEAAIARPVAEAVIAHLRVARHHHGRARDLRDRARGRHIRVPARHRRTRRYGLFANQVDKKQRSFSRLQARHLTRFQVPSP